MELKLCHWEHEGDKIGSAQYKLELQCNQAQIFLNVWLTWAGDRRYSEYRKLASLHYKLDKCIWTSNVKQVFSAGMPRVGS